jgi:hypothetical protein
MFSRSAKSKAKSNLIWIIGLFFISGSSGWRFHNAVGQIYIFYVFLLSLAFLLLIKDNKLGPGVGSFLIGITASMRFTVLFMGIPFLIYKRWKHLLWSVIGFLFGIAGSITVAGMQIWKSYFLAMRTFGKIQFTWDQIAPGNHPQIVEGMSWEVSLPVVVHHENFSFYSIFHRRFGINIASLLVPALIIFSILSVLVLFMRRKKNYSISLIFQIGILLSLMSEFLLPAIRWNYQDILWLPILALIIINTKTLKELFIPILSLAIFGLILSVGFTWLRWHNIIMEGSMLLYFVLATLYLMRNKNESYLESESDIT